MSRRAAYCLVVLLSVFALLLFLWPTIRGQQLQGNAEQTAGDFLQAQQQQTAYPELYEAMVDYNRRIYEEKQRCLADPWAYEAASLNLAEYGVESEIIAALEVQKIKLSMPVYLGATAEHMAQGTAILGQTSLPVGGENTNCVIAGHRGWKGATFFLHLDKLAVGDTVTLTTLWETLTYQVVETRIIEPSDIKQILIQDNRELLTLLTCHPYASGGRQRLVVYCERVSP